MDKHRLPKKGRAGINRKKEELEIFNSAMIDRGMRIIEMKEEVNRLTPEIEKLLAPGVAIMEPQLEEAPFCLGEMVISEDKLSVNAKLVSQSPEVMKPC